VPATRIRAMTPSSRVEAVALRTGKINKKICYKMVYYTLHLSQSSEIVFHSQKTDFSERGLAIKRLKS